MDKEERKTKIKTLLGELVLKYEPKQTATHNVFHVKPEMIETIVNNYKDILIYSDLFMDKSDDFGDFSQTIQNFDVKYSSKWLYVNWKTREPEWGYHGQIYFRLDNADIIEIDISCGEILTIAVNDKENRSYNKLSFRRLNENIRSA